MNANYMCRFERRILLLQNSLDCSLRQFHLFGHRDSGAGVIVQECIPGGPRDSIAQTVPRFRTKAFRDSIDRFERAEVEPAVDTGPELVLNYNQLNIEWAYRLPVEFVMVPDDFKDLERWTITRHRLEANKRLYRRDPVLEPIGLGFTQSIMRYCENRRMNLPATMMMGSET